MSQRIAGRITGGRCRGAAILSLVVVTVACSRSAESPEAALQPVRVGKVKVIRPEAPERYSAVIVASAQVDLAFKSPGLIESIYQVSGADGRKRNVQAGDRVTRGTELAVVRKLEYEQRLEQARQQAGQARAQLAVAETGLRQAELDFARADRLHRTDSLTKPDFDLASSRYDSAKAQVEAAKSTLGLAQVAVSEAQLALSDTSLDAPITGWITARNVECGSLVGGAFVGFSMVDTSTVKAVFAVSDTSLKSVRLGQRLAVMLDALQHSVTGTVTTISPQADPRSRVFSVEISLPNARDEVRPGMIGSITLGPKGEVRPRLAIPLSAVVRAPGGGSGFAVFRLEERAGQVFARAQEIEVGETFGNSIEVTGGIAAGERIVILGGALLRDGQQVRLLL